jgi:hypothetical protein
MNLGSCNIATAWSKWFCECTHHDTHILRVYTLKLTKSSSSFAYDSDAMCLVQVKISLARPPHCILLRVHFLKKISPAKSKTKINKCVSFFHGYLLILLDLDQVDLVDLDHVDVVRFSSCWFLRFRSSWFVRFRSCWFVRFRSSWFC